MRSIIPSWLHPSKASVAPAVAVGYWLVVVLVALPAVGRSTWAGPARGGLTLIAAGAIGAGILRNAPTRRWPWAATMVAIAAGWLADHRWPELWLLAFLALAVGLLRLGRQDDEGPATATLLDTLTLTLLLVLLTVVIGGTDRESLTRGYPLAVIGAILLVAAGLRLVVVGPRSPAVGSLVAATLAALVADVAAVVGATGATAPLPLVAHLCVAVATGCLGWAALHPSMATLTETEPAPARQLTLRYLRRRLVPRAKGGFGVVALTALVAPAALLVQALTGDVRDGVVLAVGGAALTLVALARVATGTQRTRSLVFQTSIDTLTGLASRSHLMRRLTIRTDPPWSAVLLVDLDDFRQVNEDAGPSLGDAVLITLAARLRRLASPDDIVARFGGDEFAILVAGPRDLTALTLEVVAATTEPVLVAGRTVPVSACIGVAVPPGAEGGPSGTRAEPGGSAAARAELSAVGAGGEEMVRRAGMALRAAKAAGPGEWCRYDSDRHALLIERLKLREALTRAVDEGAFRLAYQPIVALATGETVGFEALVRWAHPSRGLVGPAEFIAVAEETGLIEAIGDLVLRTAVAEAVGWPRSDIYISVNVSPRQLGRPGFAERVEEVLNAAGLPADRLMLELTESAVTRGSDHVWGELAVLRSRGVRLAIDDFGTGFSSLSYLEQTPIGVIKMDKSFVDSLVLSDRQRTVVDGIVSMGHNLGLQVVAEGIETVAERDLLAAMNCPYGQGYLFSAPLTSTEVIGWLAHPSSRAVPTPRPTVEAAVEYERAATPDT